jgi:hypothetical protein
MYDELANAADFSATAAFAGGLIVRRSYHRESNRSVSGELGVENALKKYVERAPPTKQSKGFPCPQAEREIFSNKSKHEISPFLMCSSSSVLCFWQSRKSGAVPRLRRIRGLNNNRKSQRRSRCRRKKASGRTTPLMADDKLIHNRTRRSGQPNSFIHANEKAPVA